MANKRKAGPAATISQQKKVRMGSESIIGEPDIKETSNNNALGRPKRAAAGEPRYNFARPRLTSSQKAETEPAENVAQDDPAPIKRGRGRPSKASIEAEARQESVQKDPDTPMKPAQVASPLPGKRSVGRPRKSAAKKFNRIKAHGTHQSARSASQIATKQTMAPKVRTTKKMMATSTTKTPIASKPKRGRPPKKTTAVASLAYTEFTTDEGTETEIDGGEQDEYPDRQYWLMKAEPESRIEKGYDVKFSINDLEQAEEPEPWDGVRNPVARNVMRAMRKGDLAFFYHSNCKIPGVVGVMQIVQEHSIDESAFNPSHPYYDPKSDRDKPKWEVVHVEFVKKFEKMVTLQELRSFAQHGGVLAGLQTLRQARLSVSSVSPAEWRFILELAGEENLEKEMPEEGKVEENELGKSLDDEATAAEVEGKANGLGNGEVDPFAGWSGGPEESTDGETEDQVATNGDA